MKTTSSLYQHVGRKLNTEEIVNIYENNPYWVIENPPIVVKIYKDGRRQMFVNIQNTRYFIKQNKYGKDEWYEVTDNE
jgi:uncharacterized protein (DUF302 family)